MTDMLTVDGKESSALAKGRHQRVLAPPIDVFESSDDLLIVADVPGVPSEGVDLRIENGTLTLEAKRTGAKEDSPALLREYDEVDFATTLRIPSGVDTAAISAEMKNGALVVRLPKVPAVKPRKIPVKS